MTRPSKLNKYSHSIRLQERISKKPAFEPMRHLSRTGAKRRSMDHSLLYPDELRAEICLNKCQIPRLCNFVNGLLICRKKNAPDVSIDTSGDKWLDPRLNQTNLHWRINEITVIGGERSEYRLQSAGLRYQAQPTEVGTLNALPRWFEISRDGKSTARSCAFKHHLPSSTLRRVSTPLARISGAYIAWPTTGKAWNLPGVSARS